MAIEVNRLYLKRIMRDVSASVDMTQCPSASGARCHTRSRRMKALKIITIILLAFLDQLRAEQIPFPEFYVSVQTNDFLNRPGKKTALSVSVQVGRFHDNPQGRIDIDVNCYEFDAGIRGFDDQDRRVFLQATSAAKEGKKFATTIVSPALTPRQIETRFESTQVNGAWLVRVIRGEQAAVFQPEEGERLAKALDEARAGEAWFQSLLRDPISPKPNQERHPPRSRGYYVDSKIGEVDGGDLTYQVALSCTSFRELPTYSTQHGISFRKNGERIGFMAGKWVESLLQQISQGLDSLDQNADYSFIPDDRRYKVEANRQNGEVDVTIARGDFFTDRTPVIGHFGRAQLQQIGTLIA